MSASVLLHLMRHGEPVLAGRLLGRTDCAVTQAGIAACLAQAEGIEVARIVSSDLARARACADAVAATRGLAVTIDPAWREIDFGAWDGLAAVAIDPAALGRFWDDPDAAPPPGGQRWSALVERVATAVAGLEQDVLVVTHGGAMRAALAHLCGFGQRQIWAFDLPYAALLTLRLWPGDTPSAQIVGLWP